MIDFLNSYDELTASEKKALKYMVDHTDEMPYMTIQQLANNAFVSKTVIINLCQKLGFSGFKEFKFFINQEMRTRIKQTHTDDISVKENMTKTMEKTLSLVLDEELQACATAMLNARNIFIMARGTSKPVCYYLEHLLFSLGLHCFFIKDYNLSESFTNLVTEEDVVILISLSGNTKKIMDTAKKVKMRKAKMISLTSFQSNALSSYADLNLYCHATEIDTRENDFISRIGFFMLIDLLVGTLIQQMKKSLLT